LTLGSFFGPTSSCIQSVFKKHRICDPSEDFQDQILSVHDERTLKAQKILFRKSMDKFDTKRNRLEVVEPATYQ
jgi:hypothetical protein